MEHDINLYAIVKFVVYVLAVFGLFYVLQTLIHAVKDKILGIRHIECEERHIECEERHIEREEKSRELDSDIIQELIKKFPDVSEEFIKKSEKLQNIENNQEIHDINKKIRRLEEKR